MKLIDYATQRRRAIFAAKLTGIMLAWTLFAGAAVAQMPCGDTKPADGKPNTDTYRTFFLTYSTQQNDLNEIQTDLRNLLPRAKIYGVPTQNAISLCATPEDLQLAQKVIAELDKPKKTYRLTYTITELENSKPTATQHFSILVAEGAKGQFKLGNRVPIVTGKFDTASAGPANTQVQYLDIGLSIEASLDPYADGVRLRTKVEQSSVADEKSGIGTEDPVVHQSTLEGTSTLVPGKPVTLGSLDIPGTMRNKEIEVVAEAVK